MEIVLSSSDVRAGRPGTYVPKNLAGVSCLSTDGMEGRGTERPAVLVEAGKARVKSKSGSSSLP